jgi:acetoin utilization protein AcuB
MANTDVFEMAALCVRDIMTQAVVTLTPQRSVPEAITLLAQHRFRHLPVVEDAQDMVGIVSDRDLLRALTRGANVDQMTVQEIMKPQVVAVRPETPLSAATTVMLQHRINCVPVLDDEKRLCGIVTSTDLLRVFQQVQEEIEQGR